MLSPGWVNALTAAFRAGITPGVYTTHSGSIAQSNFRFIRSTTAWVTLSAGLAYAPGVFARNVIGHRFIVYADSLLAKVPIFRQLYFGIKQIVESFANPNKTGFMQVVLVEFPRPGLRAIGFITNEVTDAAGEKLLSVLIPTAPNPTSGFLQILHERDIIRTDISVDDALKMVVSAGRMTPPEVHARMP